MFKLTARPSARRRHLTGALAGTATLVALAAATALAPTLAASGAQTAASAAVPAPDAVVAEPAMRSAAGESFRPPVRHVFVLMLENKGFDETFGPHSQAPYLARTLRAKGQLLPDFYGVAHHSLPNYLAQISGQAPNRVTQADCGTFTPFRMSGTAGYGQAVGSGCVYPARVRTVADQLTAAGWSWREYAEDMGTPCQHPAVGAADRWHNATRTSQYATRHNPFMYFSSIIGDARSCAQHAVALRHLADDLEQASTTANLTYITPDLCSDGHDTPCVDGRPGGLRSANAFLKIWVPRILNSPAYRDNGLLVVTSDESEMGSAAACCGERPGPNVKSPGLTGPGGGRVGALVVSRYVTAGSRNVHDYNHYSLLATIEDAFALPRLGFAQGAPAFGRDVFSRP